MKEIKYNGNLYLLPNPMNTDACIVTTNGIVRKDGRAVMGAGIAKYCRDNFLGVDKMLGKLLIEKGNHVYSLGKWPIPDFRTEEEFFLFSFPTKEDWKEDSKPELIQRSCRELKILADEHKLDTIYMPCPGCGRGKLDYVKDVRPILLKELDDRFVICIPNWIIREYRKKE